VLACVVDCIDCAADSAIVAAILEGVTAAQDLTGHLNASEMSTIGMPWLMVSITEYKYTFNGKFFKSIFPLVLAYVMTGHKYQGTTICSEVLVDVF
jgi:hypothetical protein